MTNNHDIGKAFEKLKGEMFLPYKGLMFEITNAGYVHKGTLCRSFEEMDLLVLHEREALANSINKQR